MTFSCHHFVAKNLYALVSYAEMHDSPHSRRKFLKDGSAIVAGFTSLRTLIAENDHPLPVAKDDLIADPRGILDLPRGYSYSILDRFGDPMSDGCLTPGRADGMACFQLPSGELTLIRNHEIGPDDSDQGPFRNLNTPPRALPISAAWQSERGWRDICYGGTSSLVLSKDRQSSALSYMSLLGTNRNCAGGPTPWNSWITCEEPSDLTSKDGLPHGYCFEVKAAGNPALQQAVALKAMGRFRHEAIAIDPNSGYVYLTEDRNDGCLYRFRPQSTERLSKGGKLDALAVVDQPHLVTRNWRGDKTEMPIGHQLRIEWIPLEDVESPNDDLRKQAQAKGAALFSRGEGMWFGTHGNDQRSAVYFACTDGGPKQNGQIFRIFPAAGPQGDTLELYLQPENSELLQNADNLCINPSSRELFICEDTKSPCYIRRVDESGRLHTFARNAFNSSEFAGSCFSPDGKTLFVNIQVPGITFAIHGPFA